MPNPQKNTTPHHKNHKFSNQTHQSHQQNIKDQNFMQNPLHISDSLDLQHLNAGKNQQNKIKIKTLQELKSEKEHTHTYSWCKYIA